MNNMVSENKNAINASANDSIFGHAFGDNFGYEG